MTQKDKELLLKDLCARLPYGVKIDREWIASMSGSPEHSTMEFDTFDIEVIKTSIELGEEGDYRDGKMRGLTICDDGKNHFVRGYMCKPYLRPMSSMTEDERKEYNDIVKNTIDFYDCPKSEKICFFIMPIDWLNKHHFDYRGLIEKGLALEALEGMYNKKRG